MSDNISAPNSSPAGEVFAHRASGPLLTWIKSLDSRLKAAEAKAADLEKKVAASFKHVGAKF
jgi:hypothetical protein